jgi:Holliday junction resolvase RusA-like endonuclease
LTDLLQSPPLVVQANQWRLSVPGEPRPWGRARLRVIQRRGGGKAMAVQFTPEATRNYEAEIRALAHLAWRPRLPLDEVAIAMQVDVYRSIPQSMSLKRQQLAAAGHIRPIGKPDADNFVKSVCDAFNKVIFRDDGLVVELVVRKWYSVQPRMEVALSWSGQ